MVVWIEIGIHPDDFVDISVTTCVVVWIEILHVPVYEVVYICHHLRGGVD